MAKADVARRLVGRSPALRRSDPAFWSALRHCAGHRPRGGDGASGHIARIDGRVRFQRLPNGEGLPLPAAKTPRRGGPRSRRPRCEDARPELAPAGGR